MDIAMTRDQYEKFIAVFPKCTDTNTFFLENWDTEPGFGLTFSKVKLNGTLFEEHSAKGLSLHKGIFVDIFPLDRVPNDPAAILRTASKLDHLAKLYKFSLGYLPTKPDHQEQYYLSKVIGTAGKLLPKSALREQIQHEITRYNQDEQARYLAAVGGGGAHRKDAFPEELVQNILMVPFEDETLPIPAGYDTILTCLFGNYMEFPPEEERVFRHHPERIDFGIYAPAMKG